MPNTPASATLTTADIERRTNSFNARKTLLRSNPSLFISKTRLSIRQIPIFVSERLLKRLAIHAVRAFQADVKKELREPLSADEIAVVVDDDGQDVDSKDIDSKGKRKRPTGRRTGVKQTKIVRQMERVDPVTGKGRSKGYGFLEMQSHADALRVLRWSNNNPETNGLFEEWWKDELEDLLKQEKAKEQKDDARIKRIKEELENGGTRKSKGTLIVEFSIENVQVVQRRNAAQAKGLVRLALVFVYFDLLKKHFQGKGSKEENTRDSAPKKSEKPEERPPKKRRTSEEKSKPTKEESVKPGQGIGAMIGRKRKERQGKKH